MNLWGFFSLFFSLLNKWRCLDATVRLCELRSEVFVSISRLAAALPAPARLGLLDLQAFVAMFLCDYAFVKFTVGQCSC